MPNNDSSYLFALTNPGNEDLLKEQVRLKLPNFSLSFSKSGFCTFKKQNGPVSVKDLEAFPQGFYRLIGVDAKKVEGQPRAYFSCSEQKSYGERGDFFSFEVAPNQYWQAPLVPSKQSLQADYGTPVFAQPEAAPSRAYLKMAQSFDLKQLTHSREQIKKAIELGCAPGGASYALLEKGIKVVGIDPAEVNEDLRANPAFTFINLSVQELKRHHFKEDFDLLASDMNLNPELTIKYCLEVVKLLRRPPTLLLITLKTPEPRWCGKLEALAQKVKAAGYQQVELAQLPAHRRETLLLAKW